MRKKIFGVSICCMVILLSPVSCNRGSGTPTTNYMITPQEVSDGACLSLQKLLARINTFPADTQGRRVTTDIKLQGSPTNRRSFLALLARGTFHMEERDLSSLMDYSAAQQNGCGTTSLLNDGSRGEEYRINQFSDKSLALVQDGGKSMTVTLLGPQSLQIEMNYTAVDICNNEDKVTISTSQIIRWGQNEISKVTDEAVSGEMLRVLSTTTDNMPASLTEAISNGVQGPVNVPVLDLKAFKESPIKTEMLGCFPPAPQPIPPPEMPTPTPAPSS